MYTIAYFVKLSKHFDGSQYRHFIDTQLECNFIEGKQFD